MFKSDKLRKSDCEVCNQTKMDCSHIVTYNGERVNVCKECKVSMEITRKLMALSAKCMVESGKYERTCNSFVVKCCKQRS